MTDDRPRFRLTDISATAWEHPADRAALQAMRRLPGFELVLRKLVGMFGERAVRLTFRANAVLVSETQYPWIHERVTAVCAALDVVVGPAGGIHKGIPPARHVVDIGPGLDLGITGQDLIDEVGVFRLRVFLGGWRRFGRLGRRGLLREDRQRLSRPPETHSSGTDRHRYEPAPAISCLLSHLCLQIRRKRMSWR